MKKDPQLGDEFDHESYGVVGINHIGGGGSPLFGSSIKHNEVIRLSVRRASMFRNLNYDRYYGKDIIVEVDLSYSQFAEFITTHNRGTGIPCTIRYVGGKRMEDPPFINKREQHTNEFKESVDKIAEKLDGIYDTVRAMLDRPSVSKQERKDLLEKVRYARQCIASDLPFAVDQFDEQMDLSVREAKGEIEGFATRRMLLAGMEALEHDLEPVPVPQLLEGSDADRPEHGGGDVGTPSLGRDSQDHGMGFVEDALRIGTDEVRDTPGDPVL